jgi:molybdenum cofactor synthesis domain-containing protein
MIAGVLTVSDRSFRGEREDLSGPALVDRMEQAGWSIARVEIVPDEPTEIERILIAWADEGDLDVILTTGGTGFTPRDRTPEATLAVVEREAPGLVEAMRAVSLRKTAHAMLSRAVAGIRARTLIVNLPGSTRAAIENVEVILPVLPHAIALLRDDPSAEAGHSPAPPTSQA